MGALLKATESKAFPSPGSCPLELRSMEHNPRGLGGPGLSCPCSLGKVWGGHLAYPSSREAQWGAGISLLHLVWLWLEGEGWRPGLAQLF